MTTSRRTFLSAGVASACTIGHAAGGDAAEEVVPAAGHDAAVLDYGLSFICNPASFNSVRFWVESRTTLFDDAAGKSTVFYQCGSCKSENTFGEKDLLYVDNYDFMPIFASDGDLLIFRRPVRLSDHYREVKRAADGWGEPIYKLRAGGNIGELESFEAIRDATAAAVPIVSQTELRNADTGLRAIIECPVKTMNVSLDKSMYQVDTGPIAFPDLTKRYDRPIECVSLAFVVFNAPHFADFVIEQPTPVEEDEVEKCRVYHYSKPFSLEAKNRLYRI